MSRSVGIRRSAGRAIAYALASVFALVPVVPTAAQRVAAADERRSDPARVLEDLLSRPVTVHVTHVSLRTAIDAAAASAKVPVQYRTQLLEGYRDPVSLNLTQAPLRFALEQLLAGTHLHVVPDGTTQLMLVDDASVEVQSRGGIEGRVTEAKTSRPLPGASVTLDDSGKVVRTDEAGRYRFTDLASGSHTVTVRLVGFARQTRLVTVTDAQITTANIALESSVNTLDQVVVTATGAQRYRELGHVVTVLNVDSLVKEAPVTSVSDLLQSRVPGLQVVTLGGGLVGGPVSLQLRGQSSLNLNSEPIVIVDGVRYKSNNLRPSPDGPDQQDSRGYQGPMAESPLNALSVNDIETIEVVKGPSASTLYGPDASNGVIVITTKRGQGGKTQWNWYAHPVASTVPTTQGVAQQSVKVWSHDPADPTHAQFRVTCLPMYLPLYNACVIDSVTTGPSVYRNSQFTTLGSDKPSWQYGLNVNGGVQALKYYFSGDYLNQIGAVQVPTVMQDLLKQQLGVSSLSDAIRHPNTLQSIGSHASVTAAASPALDLTATVDYRQIGQRRAQPSTFLTPSQLAALPPGATGELGDSLTDQYLLNNPLFYMNSRLATEESQEQRMFVSLQGGWRPRAWLTANALVGLDIDDQTDHSVVPGSAYAADGNVADTRRNTLGRTGTLTATASNQVGNISFRTSAGVNYIYSRLDGLDAQGSHVASGAQSILYASSFYTTPYWSESAELGWFGQEVIGFADQLFLDGGVRLDGTSRAGEDYHPSALPKLGVSWIASDAPWLRGRLPGITNLRFRSSLGWSTSYPTSWMQLGSVGGIPFLLWGQQVVGFYRNRLADPTLRPERSRELESGLDATLLSKVDVSLSWWSRRTRDELAPVQLPDGLPIVYGNVGSVAQHGFEATASVPLVDIRRVRADLQLTYSHNTSKVLSLGQNCSVSITDCGYGSWRLGYPIDAIFDYYTVAVVDSVGGVQDHIYEPGEKIRSTDQRYYGVTTPPTVITMTPRLGLLDDRLRLSAVFDREIGFITQDWITRSCVSSLTCAAPFLPTTPIETQARLIEANPWDFYVSGDFTRWRELSLTLDLPQRWLRVDALHLAFSHASVSLQGRNLKLWARGDNVDPESRMALSGLGGGGIPQMRSWGFRFDLTP